MRSLCGAGVAEAFRPGKPLSNEQQNTKENVAPAPELSTLSNGPLSFSRFFGKGENVSASSFVQGAPKNENSTVQMISMLEGVSPLKGHAGRSRRNSGDREELILEEQDFVPEDFLKRQQFTNSMLAHALQPHLAY